MLLRDQLITQGNRLFRKRGTYFSLLALPFLALAFCQRPSAAVGPVSGWIGTMACLGVSLSGLMIRFYTIGCRARRTSGRNKRKGQVADALNTTGMYSLTRNPLYLGNFLAALGVALCFFLWWLTVIYALGFWLYYERIILAEEDFLRDKFGRTYVLWAEKTPVFLPLSGHWHPPEMPFSWRTALKGEYQTISLVVAVLAVFQIASQIRLGYRVVAEPFWFYLLCLALVFFLAVRHLRKNTRLLHVPGR